MLIQPTVQITKVSVDLKNVATLTCSEACVFLQLRTLKSDASGNIDLELTDTIGFSANMKESRSTGTVILAGPLNSDVDRDLIFCWHRGSAFSGWGYKTPMKSQRTGRRTRRFFLCRDDALSYFPKEPQSVEEVMENLEQRSLKVTRGSSVRVVKRYFTDYVMLETPVDTMWFRSRNKEQQGDWMKQIQRTLTFQERKPFFAHMDQISTTWFHELSECSCMGVDAYVSKSGSITRVSLFRTRRIVKSKVEVAPKSRSWFSRAVESSATADVSPPKVITTYAINFYRSAGDASVTQVVPDLPDDVALHCVKVVGDCIVLGGTRGFVGFCTEARFRTEEAVPPQFIMDKRQGLVHAKDTTIACINHCAMRGMIACGDDKGGLSLWMLSSPANVLLDSLQPDVFGFPITSILFSPNRNYIVVGTVKGLYVVKYDPATPEGRWFTGAAPVRVGSLYEHMETADMDASRKPNVRVLSAVSYPRDTALRSSLAGRASEGDVVIWQFIQKPKTENSPLSALLVRAVASVEWLDAHCDETVPIAASQRL